MDDHSLTREQEQWCLLSLSGVIPYRTLLQCLLDWMTIFCSWTPPLLSCVMILVSILSLALDLFTDHRFPPLLRLFSCGESDDFSHQGALQ